MPRWYTIANRVINAGLIAVGVAACVVTVAAIKMIIQG